MVWDNPTWANFTPSPTAVNDFLDSVNEDADWFPGKHNQKKRRPSLSCMGRSAKPSLEAPWRQKRVDMNPFMPGQWPIQLQRPSKQIYDAQKLFVMRNRSCHLAEYAHLQSEPTTRSRLTKTVTSCTSDLPPVHRDASYCLRRPIWNSPARILRTSNICSVWLVSDPTAGM